MVKARDIFDVPENNQQLPALEPCTSESKKMGRRGAPFPSAKPD
jgi:hypothetical protein